MKSENSYLSVLLVSLLSDFRTYVETGVNETSLSCLMKQSRWFWIENLRQTNDQKSKAFEIWSLSLLMIMEKKGDSRV